MQLDNEISVLVHRTHRAGGALRNERAPQYDFEISIECYNLPCRRRVLRRQGALRSVIMVLLWLQVWVYTIPACGNGIVTP